jgi:hypothetical protein
MGLHTFGFEVANNGSVQRADISRNGLDLQSGQTMRHRLHHG